LISLKFFMILFVMVNSLIFYDEIYNVNVIFCMNFTYFS
jgi:hypothetical protein